MMLMLRIDHQGHCYANVPCSSERQGLTNAFNVALAARVSGHGRRHRLVLQLVTITARNHTVAAETVRPVASHRWLGRRRFLSQWPAKLAVASHQPSGPKAALSLLVGLGFRLGLASTHGIHRQRRGIWTATQRAKPEVVRQKPVSGTATQACTSRSTQRQPSLMRCLRMRHFLISHRLPVHTH